MDIGLHIYDLQALAGEFDYGDMRVTEFVEAAHTPNVLESRGFTGSFSFLAWSYGVPNAVSYQTLHERWSTLPDDERQRLEEVLEQLGFHKVDTWVVGTKEP